MNTMSSYQVAETSQYDILSIVAPSWFADTFRNTIGHRRAERMLALGLQVKSDEAKAIGLVDEVVPQDKVLECKLHFTNFCASFVTKTVVLGYCLIIHMYYSIDITRYS